MELMSATMWMNDWLVHHRSLSGPPSVRAISCVVSNSISPTVSRSAHDALTMSSRLHASPEDVFQAHASPETAHASPEACVIVIKNSPIVE